MNSETQPKKDAARHFILLIDGTDVSASRRSDDADQSNVYYLNIAIATHSASEEAQVTFYFAGVGSRTAGEPFGGKLFGQGLIRRVEQAYVNIVSNFQETDKIYIFGFSRGAVIARLLADLISKCGVLHPSKICSFPAVWKHYLEDDGSILADGLADHRCYPVEIEFLGVFDTVIGSYWETDPDGPRIRAPF